MPEPPPTDAAHRHRWTGADFYLEDGRPMLRQACACGAQRRLRAFERYWEPNLAGDGGSPPKPKIEPLVPDGDPTS